MVVKESDLGKFTTHQMEGGISEGCYKYGNRIFKSSIDCMFEEKYKILKYLMQFSSKYIAFPEEFLYINKEDFDHCVGYLTKYVEGIDIYKIDENEDIRNFLRATAVFEKEIEKMSWAGLLMEDMNIGNLIYDGNILSAIDTELYEQSTMDEYETYKSNIKEIGYTYFSLFLNRKRFNEKLEKYISLCIAKGTMPPSIVLNEIIESIEKESLEKVKTFKDFNTGIKLISKQK